MAKRAAEEKGNDQQQHKAKRSAAANALSQQTAQPRGQPAAQSNDLQQQLAANSAEHGHGVHGAAGVFNPLVAALMPQLANAAAAAISARQDGAPRFALKRRT